MTKSNTFDSELAAIKTIHDALVELPEDQRKFVLSVVMEKLDIEADLKWFSTRTNAAPKPPEPPSSPNPNMSAKEFLTWKMPRTDVERVACLGFYLSRYRGEGSFKTRDITKLNMEAAWPNFSNAATALSNAHTLSGYVMPAGGGKKQLTMKGERLVEALPDRAAVQQVLAELGKGSGWKARAKSKRTDENETKK